MEAKKHPNLIEIESFEDYLIVRSYLTFLEMLPMDEDHNPVDVHLIEDMELYVIDKILNNLETFDSLSEQKKVLTWAANAFEKKWRRR